MSSGLFAVADAVSAIGAAAVRTAADLRAAEDAAKDATAAIKEETAATSTMTGGAGGGGGMGSKAGPGGGANVNAGIEGGGLRWGASKVTPGGVIQELKSMGGGR